MITELHSLYMLVVFVFVKWRTRDHDVVNTSLQAQ